MKVTLKYDWSEPCKKSEELSEWSKVDYSDESSKQVPDGFFEWFHESQFSEEFILHQQVVSLLEQNQLADAIVLFHSRENNSTQRDVYKIIHHKWNGTVH